MRPVVGEVYENLYVQLHRDYGFDQGYVEPSGQMVVSTPEEQYPDDPYYVSLYVDWISEEYHNPLSNGDVIECSNGFPYPIEPGWKFSFDKLT